MSRFSTRVTLSCSELPEREGWEVGEEEAGRRRDLRGTHLVFSVDPQGCEDVDDTLSVRYEHTDTATCSLSQSLFCTHTHTLLL